jgi:hypothetical protein
MTPFRAGYARSEGGGVFRNAPMSLRAVFMMQDPQGRGYSRCLDPAEQFDFSLRTELGDTVEIPVAEGR